MVTGNHVSQEELSQAASAAIEAAGGGAKLAKVCGVTRFAVQQWKVKGIPAHHLWRVSEAAGMPPQRIRRDLFQPVIMPANPTEAA